MVKASSDAAVPPKHSIDVLTYRSVKRSRDIFLGDHGKLPVGLDDCRQAKLRSRTRSEYTTVMHLPPPKAAKKEDNKPPLMLTDGSQPSKLVKDSGSAAKAPAAPVTSGQLALIKQTQQDKSLAIKAPVMPKPNWHPQWKLMRVISGHLGWVRCCAVEPGNEWFVTGSADRTIKIWDLASGTLKLSLTGHISAIRALAVSSRQPYLFSAGEDKQVKCWDLEQNKVIRHYHGHLSAVYSMALHPTLDVVMTGGRDGVVRVWDMRTKAQVHCLTGHTNTISSIVTRSTDPQVISGSHDSTVRLWDLAAGRSMCTLTNHKKSVRAVANHPKENTFASASPDNIKQWYLPNGKFIQNLPGHNSVINSLAVNHDGVLVSAADNGTMSFWDYRTGYRFQQSESIVQPGSLDSEAGIFSLTFDRSGSRLITTEADKTIKIYKEDENSTPETHPVDWKPSVMRKARF